MNPLRNWIENWLFGNRLREVEGQVMYANDHADELRERIPTKGTEPMNQINQQIQALTRLINRELRNGRVETIGGRKIRACNVPGTIEAGKVAMWRSQIMRLNESAVLMNRGRA